ncbi:hypothetical protein SAM23877_4332 [Streptomyces ambofaciens ATCC 23877]|uniref:Uncharacterized protein n=1 Tax=Streptomyces ambofaciens (strain ATCC 23877 / 3486 / DSM 40053 / JCM 4204 / NBRC 12836 / NRRL B-2516) TaxID=278992 RepID=A0A0K2AX21_STRA7|nr:hypothetical protein [Streptomyces ambofaciens]AKZ57377.1 hypothetical protein SAM23877_4332 [Streptomyces ambofaciens ATCC 23877]
MTSQPDLAELIPTHPAPVALHADDVHVRWVMPEIFHDIPIHVADDDEAVRLLGELVEKALPGAGDEAQTALAVTCALGVDDLLAAGAEYAGICVTVVDDSPCAATVLAGLLDSPDAADVPGAVEAIATDLRRFGDGEVTRIDLPCGWAVSYVGAREDKLLGELTATGEDLPFPTWFIRVCVPLPHGTTFMMEMSTSTMAGWDAFSTMFGNTVRSIRLFHADGSPLITSLAEA